MDMVGTSRCDVPARVQRAEQGRANVIRVVNSRSDGWTPHVAPLNAARTAQRAVPTIRVASRGGISTLTAMQVPRRESLPHEVPLWVDPQKEIYFITINCAVRGSNQLALPQVAHPLFETVEHRQQNGLWWPHLFLVMPDHVHALISFPPSGKPLQSVISKWKEWTAKQLGIVWQRDFFEHRLRREESRREKADYILNNPVRKGLVSRAEDWPYVYFADGARPPW
jgi:REP element-mobilizing transposase RayT